MPELRPWTAKSLTALRLRASDATWAEINGLTDDLGRLLWKRRLDLIEAEELAYLADVQRRLHNLIDPLARSSAPLAEELHLGEDRLPLPRGSVKTSW